MQGVNLSDCSYPTTETGTWAGFTHWSVFPLGCLTFIKNGWKDHSGNFTINRNCQASPFLKLCTAEALPIRSATQIRVVTRHQCGISALFSQTSLGGGGGGEASNSVAKCWLFCQGTRSKASFESQNKTPWVARRYTSNSIPEDPKSDHLPWEAVHAPRPPGRSAQNSGNFGLKSNGTDYFDSVRPEYLGPPFKVVHFDRSVYLGRSDRNVPFHLTKLLSPVPLFSILLACARLSDSIVGRIKRAKRE